MIGKIAVSAANFAIDKPYSYLIPVTMELQPGQRVMVPFGRSNRHTEGVVLSIEEGNEAGLKTVVSCLDDAPVLSLRMLQLAAFMRERYFSPSGVTRLIRKIGTSTEHTRRAISIGICLKEKRGWRSFFSFLSFLSS